MIIMFTRTLKEKTCKDYTFWCKIWDNMQSSTYKNCAAPPWNWRPNSALEGQEAVVPRGMTGLRARRGALQCPPLMGLFVENTGTVRITKIYMVLQQKQSAWVKSHAKRLHSFLTLFNIVEAPFKKHIFELWCPCCMMMFRWTNKQPGIQKVFKFMRSLSRYLWPNITTE